MTEDPNAIFNCPCALFGNETANIALSFKEAGCFFILEVPHLMTLVDPHWGDVEPPAGGKETRPQEPPLENKDSWDLAPS